MKLLLNPSVTALRPRASQGFQAAWEDPYELANEERKRLPTCQSFAHLTCWQSNGKTRGEMSVVKEKLQPLSMKGIDDSTNRQTTLACPPLEFSPGNKTSNTCAKKIECYSMLPHRWRTPFSDRSHSAGIRKNQQFFCWTLSRSYIHCEALRTSFGKCATPTAPQMWTCASCFPALPLPEANGWFDFWKATLRLTCGLSRDTTQGYTTLKYRTKLYVIMTCSSSGNDLTMFSILFHQTQITCVLQIADSE